MHVHTVLRLARDNASGTIEYSIFYFDPSSHWHAVHQSACLTRLIEPGLIDAPIIVLVSQLLIGNAITVICSRTPGTRVYDVCISQCGLSVAGLGLDTEGKLFVGWFGPRGLASIVFAVIVMNSDVPGSGEIATVVAWTVMLSVIAHGVTANPWARAYGARSRQRG